VDVARIIRSSRDFVLSCLVIIEGQVRELDPERKALRESKVRELQKLGFRVVRLPQVGGGSDLQSDWAGISYVNNLVVDNAFFLSIFGLDSLERRLVCLLEKELPKRYQIIPAFAQHMIIYNGGIHCLFGIVRRVSE
jgi:agmatine/peptidylarginine deiminase